MARTVVHARPGVDAPGGGDDYLAKLAKYVPAEVVSLFVTLVALTGDDKTLLLVWTGVGLVATPLWFLFLARRQATNQQPRAYFYALATLAFAVWALGTTPALGDLFNLTDPISAAVLVLGVFFIPLIDGLLS